MITIQGGPNATASVPGPHNDASDFWGSGLVILVIIGAIALTRLVFRRPRDEQVEETSNVAPDTTTGTSKPPSEEGGEG